MPNSTIPVALLQKWYSLVREKRAAKQDFLKALTRVFDLNDATKTTQTDVEFTVYMAENFASFDYKIQEEVLTVIAQLTKVLSTMGMQLVEILSPSNLLVQLHAPTGDGTSRDNVSRNQNHGNRSDYFELGRRDEFFSTFDFASQELLSHWYRNASQISPEMFIWAL